MKAVYQAGIVVCGCETLSVKNHPPKVVVVGVVVVVNNNNILLLVFLPREFRVLG